MRPGCKADHVPILEAGQGKLKSSAVEALFTPWFTDDLAEFGSKDASMQIQGAWGVEIAELASMQRGEVERVKAFISRRTDRFRPSYGRYVIERPRQCNFVGTTNAEAYLKDETGGRRFWPVKCGNINLDILARDRDQLWAESVAMYCKGTQWWLSDDSTVAAAAEAQAARYTPDAWQTPIAEHLATVSDCTSVAEILVDVLGIEKSRWDQQAQTRVARCLKIEGWERFRGPRPLRKHLYRNPMANGQDTGASDPDWDQ
jgi:predicted P-loop ATPase